MSLLHVTCIVNLIVIFYMSLLCVKMGYISYIQVATCAVQCVKENIHARLTGLPVCPEITRDTLPKANDVDRLLSICGTVTCTFTYNLALIIHN